MKKVLSLILVLCLAFSLTACGGGASSSGGNDQAAAAASKAESTAAAAASTAASAADMTAEGILILKVAMMVFPLICIVVGFIIYRKKYILDEEMYKKIVEELNGSK